MRNTLSALVRWLAIGGLWLLMGVLIVPVMILHWVSGAGLAVIAELKATADMLRDNGPY